MITNIIFSVLRIWVFEVINMYLLSEHFMSDKCSIMSILIKNWIYLTQTMQSYIQNMYQIYFKEFSDFKL